MRNNDDYVRRGELCSPANDRQRKCCYLYEKRTKSKHFLANTVRPYEHNRHYYAKYAPVLIVSASGDDTASPLQDLYELENSSINGNLKSTESPIDRGPQATEQHKILMNIFFEKSRRNNHGKSKSLFYYLPHYPS